MRRSLEPTQSIGARGDVAVWDVGEGEPVLLMHGFPDHAIGLLDAAERFAAEGYRAIVVSYPGYWPSSPAPATSCRCWMLSSCHRCTSSVTAGERSTATGSRAGFPHASAGWSRLRRPIRSA